MKKLFAAYALLVALLIVPSVLADHTPDPSGVAIVGSLQSELGCSGDWQPDCAATDLGYDSSDDVWQGQFSVLAGNWEYKAALNDSWDENYGAGAQQNGPNIPLTLGAPTDVKFYYDHKSHWVTDNVNSVIATVPGSYQTALGCSGDWQPDCLRCWLQDPDGDGIHTFSTDSIPAGSYEAKVAIDESWDENYGAGGVPNGPNIAFAVGVSETVTFVYNPVTHVLTISSAPTPVQIEVDPVELAVSQSAGVQTTEPLTITNTGDSPLDWSVVEGEGACDSPTDIPWLSVSPDAGTTAPLDSTLMDVTFDSTGLAPGDYTASLCIASSDPAQPLLQIPVALTVEAPPGPPYAVIHYFREDGDYGDHTTGDFNDFWGVHLWGDVGETVVWTAPKPFLGEDLYGRFAWVELLPEATNVGFIVHRGDIKDGTTADRFFDPSVNTEIWIRNDDATVYASQTEAQGFVTIHYHRDDGDYGDPTSDDFNDYWGVHLWGDAIDPSQATGWTSPKKPSGLDDYGAFWEVAIVDAEQSVEFLIHRGDSKDPGPDQAFVPVENAAVWIQSGDETIYPQRGKAEDFAVLHYHRTAGDYGDPTSSDYNEFWGLHAWFDALYPTLWTTPLKPAEFDTFGAVFHVDLVEDAEVLAYILHRGDDKDPGPDQHLVFDICGYEVWQLQGADVYQPYVLPVNLNRPPSVAVDDLLVIVNEGETAANSGIVSDVDGDTVTLSVSAGIVVNNGDGTWSWSMTTNDGPDDSQLVTITADDGGGGIDKAIFSLTVDNVAPTINAVSNNGPILEGGSAEVAVAASDPAGAHDPLAYCFDCDDDGLFETGPQADPHTTCSFAVAGDYIVHAMVADDDGAATLDSTTVSVLNPQEAIDEFIASEVEEWVADGDLAAGQGNSLISKLSNAMDRLDDGNETPAIKLLQAFIKQINALIKGGFIDPGEGQVLIDQANSIIAAITS